MKKIIKRTSGKKLYPVKIYFDSEKIPKRIKEAASQVSLSMSSATGLIIRYGLPEFEKIVYKILGEDEKVKNAKRN